MSKIALVASGGGSKGAFQALIIRWLDYKGITPDFYVGSSSGFICGVGLSLFGSRRLIEWWGEIKSIRDIFSFNWRLLWQSGVFTTKPLKKKIDVLKDFKFAFPVYGPLTNAETGETHFERFEGDDMGSEVKRQRIVDAVTIPGVVRSDSGYVDGGAMILCPLKKAIDLGADEIYIILERDPLVPKADFKPSKWLSVVAYGNRFLELLMFTVIKNDIATCVRINEQIKSLGVMDKMREQAATGKKQIKLHILYPKTPLYDSLDFKMCREMLTMTGNIAQIDDVDLRSDL